MVGQIGGSSFAWGSRTYVMGIVNVTPDSFSGDGLAHDPEAAVRQGLRMVAEGADIIDVGGESTRPGHVQVPAEEELRRALPVVQQLAQLTDRPISIDTTKPAVAEAALEAGASIVNDVWGLKRSPQLAKLAASADAALVVMHNQENTEYGDVVQEVVVSLRRSVDEAREAGVAQGRIIIDPGIGFGKTWEQNLVLLRRLEELKQLDQPLLVGTSRKSLIGRVLGESSPQDRLEGTAASVAAAVLRGADIVRVHDVAEMVRVVRMAEALR